MKKLPHPNNLVPLSGTGVKESELTSPGSLEEVDHKALMLQTGYLTIEGYSTASKHYQLGFPKQEVRGVWYERRLLVQEPLYASRGALDRIYQSLSLPLFF